MLEGTEVEVEEFEPAEAAWPEVAEFNRENIARGLRGEGVSRLKCFWYGQLSALVEPIAHAYRDDLPPPIRNGLTNFFRNLREPVVFLNFLLQLKPGKAVGK